MRNQSLSIALVFVAGGVIGTSAVNETQPSPGLKGEPGAIALARTMIERMGGRKIWAAAAALHVVEEAQRDEYATPARAEMWRDVRSARLWGRTTSTTFDRQFAFTSTSGWRLDAGTVTPLSDVEVVEWRGRWRGNIYVMYHRLAAEDSVLRIDRDGPRRFSVYDATTGEKLSTFGVNAGGDITYWSLSFGRASEEWVYGPLTDFGTIRMPAWGARTDGSYRFRYVSVTLSNTPPPVSFDAPAAKLLP